MRVYTLDVAERRACLIYSYRSLLCRLVSQDLFFATAADGVEKRCQRRDP